MGGGDTLPRFFIEPRETGVGDRITLCGEDHRHIAYSLRARVGETYTLCDAVSYEYTAVIRNITDKDVTFEITEKCETGTEPTVEVTLYQALTKSDKFDNIVQKATELGVTKIVPVLSDRCVSRPDAASLSKKIERWQKIAKAAAMQCARARVPHVSEAVDFMTAIRETSDADCGFLCYENEPHEPLASIFSRANADKRAASYAFLVGPEGGIAPKEANAAMEMGIPLASLGKRILRTETAPLCVISAIMFYSDNLS